MQRTDFQTTQAYIDNLVDLNRQMEENQQQLTPVIQGLMDKVALLTSENEQLKTLLEQSINELEELRKAKEEKLQMENEFETMKHENGRMKEENDNKIGEIKTLQQKVYLVEQSYSCQLDDLKIQLTRKEEIIGNMKEQYELLNEEVQMGRKQIQILVDELEKQRNESEMKNVMKENLNRMNELNGLFDQFKEFFSGNGSIGNFHLCCNDNFEQDQWNGGQMNEMCVHNDQEMNSSSSSTQTETGEPSEMMEEQNEMNDSYENNNFNNNNNLNNINQLNEMKEIENIEEMREENHHYQNEIQEEQNEIKEVKEIKQNEMIIEKSDIDGMQIENPLSEVLLQPIGMDNGKEVKRSIIENNENDSNYTNVTKEMKQMDEEKTSTMNQYQNNPTSFNNINKKRTQASHKNLHYNYSHTSLSFT